MIRTQIQLPDHLYKELKRVAAENEMSLAEVIRRGAEYITQVYKPLEEAPGTWKLPGPFNLGVEGDPFAEPDWRCNLHTSRSEPAMVRDKPTAGPKTKKKSKS
jgi:hypothetical protein